MFYYCSVSSYFFLVYMIFYLNVRDDDDDVGYEHAHITSWFSHYEYRVGQKVSC